MDHINNSSRTEEIVFGGRTIRATPVELTPRPDETAAQRQHFEQASVNLESVNQTQDELQLMGMNLSLSFNALENSMPPLVNEVQDDLDFGYDFEFDEEANEANNGELDISVDDYDIDNMDFVIVNEPSEVIFPLPLYENVGPDEQTIRAAMKRETFQAESHEHSSDATIDPTCSICLEGFQEGHELGILECNHKFHYNCILEWITRDNSCPLCRTTGVIV